MKNKATVSSEYEFIRCVGEGLSSTVYEANRINRSGIGPHKVAVKILKSQNSVSWLQNEFEVLRNVTSPHCVRVLANEAFNEGPALILEFVEGVTLFDLARRYSLSAREIVELGRQVYLGLKAIHQTGTSHGDLNPKNILVSKDGIAKLIDFGSFKDCSQLIGSAPYVAHELWNGAQPCIETDLQSWQLITKDVADQFTKIPSTLELARARAALVNGEAAFETDSKADDSAIEELSRKVQSIISSRSPSIQTQMLRSASKRRVFISRFIALIILVFLPAQMLMSEPLLNSKSDSAFKEWNSSVIIRTLMWTEVALDGSPPHYAPANFFKLRAGRHTLKYRREAGFGELTLVLNPGQRLLLTDRDFNR